MRRRQKNDWLTIILLLLIFGTGITCAIVFGVVYAPSPPPSTTTTVVTTTTPSPTTTPTPTLAPCSPPDYTLITNTPVPNLFYFGQWADYYATDNSITYFNVTANPENNFTVTKVDKDSQAVIWSQVSCKIDQEYGQYLVVDATTGDTIFVYQCIPFPNVIADRYDVSGNLIWRVNVSAVVGISVYSLASPIEIDQDHQQFYFAYYTHTDTRISALRISDGSLVWSNTGNIDYGGVAYALGYVYAISVYGTGHGHVYKLNATTGITVASFTSPGIYYGLGVAANRVTGDVYQMGPLSPQYSAAVVDKYDSELNLVWETVLPPFGPLFGNTFSARNVLYDPISNRVVIGADVGYTPNGNGTGDAWFATLDASNGNLLTFYKTQTILTQYLRWTTIFPHYEAGEVFMGLQNLTYLTGVNPYEVIVYCYVDAPLLCTLCNAGALVQASTVSSNTNIDYDIYRNRLIVPKIVAPGAIISAGTDWNATLCAFGYNNTFGIIYVTVDERIGSVIVIWRCLPSDGELYVGAFDINGALAWIRVYASYIEPSDALQITYNADVIYFLKKNSTTAIILEGLDRFTGISKWNVTVISGDLNGPNKIVVDPNQAIVFVASGFANGFKLISYNTGGFSIPPVTFNNANIRYVNGISLFHSESFSQLFIVGTGIGSTNLFMAQVSNSYTTYTLNWLVYTNATSNTFSYTNAVTPVYIYPPTSIVYDVASVSDGTILLTGRNFTDGSIVSQSSLPIPPVAYTSGATFAVDSTCNGKAFIQYSATTIATNITETCF